MRQQSPPGSDGSPSRIVDAAAEPPPSRGSLPGLFRHRDFEERRARPTGRAPGVRIMQEYYFGLVPGEEAIDRLVDGILRDPGDSPRDGGHLNGLWSRMRLRWAAAHP